MSGSSPRLSKRLQEKLYECVSQQPVTIVIGPTGCGKSTLVPSFLMDRMNGPVLCTQPRRLAVVAVATRVAQERNCELGAREIGYHVGAANHTTSTTQLVYTTAGILLEELRCQGPAQALSRYKCIVIDECHERSPESDLVLALIRNVFANKRKYPAAFTRNLRLVLMSATFDHDRYRTYFQESAKNIDIINLETADSFSAFYDRVETHYLDSIIPLLPDKEKHASLQKQMRINPDEALLSGHDGGKTVPEMLLNIIQSLVEYLDNRDSSSSSSCHGVFMIFAPTYRQLEQIYERLHYYKLGANRINNTEEKQGNEWQIGVLHSSVDMEFCLRNMMETTASATTITGNNNNNNNNKKLRKILLASAVADSSVTVPGVTVVIDLCRSLSVKWDISKSQHVPKTVWSSKSICDQRRGRTGRTCAGTVYRLVPKKFFIERLQEYEPPQLMVSSCRNEILKLLCAAKQNHDNNNNKNGKIMPASSASDPTAFLRQCLDPPPDQVTSQAMDYLVRIQAATGANSRRDNRMWTPTRYGELLATLPFQVQESTILIKGGQLGILHEVLTMQAIRSHKPAPIAHQFAKEYANEEAMAAFYPNVNVKNTTSIDMANFAAFIFWDSQWNGVHRARATKLQFACCTEYPCSYDPDLLNFSSEAGNRHTACCDVWKWTPSLEEKHIEWCEQHGINPTAVRGIAELLESTWNILFHSDFEPEWLRCTEPTPLWRRQSDWKGVDGENDMLGKVYGASRVDRLYNTLVALYQNPLDATLESTGLGVYVETSLRVAASDHRQRAHEEPFACVFFLQGSCSYGSKCRNSHSPSARRPPCRFYQESGFCARGENCVFSHSAADDEKRLVTKRPSDSTIADPLKAMAPLQPGLFIESTEDWFLEHCDSLLLLGEGNFEFTRALHRMHSAPYAASTNGKVDEGCDNFRIIGDTLIFNVDATRVHKNDDIVDMVDEGNIDGFAWNFPFTGCEEDVESHESLILGTLYSLKLLADRCRQTIRFAITLQGDQFARWNVLRSCHRTGWRLTAWGEFDTNDYPSYHPRRENGDRFPASCARFYVLETPRSA